MLYMMSSSQGPETPLGVDLIEIDRISLVIDRWKNRFLQRIYNPRELDYCRGKAERFAALFAAKESVMKALGTGTRGVGWREIEVVHKPSGQPTIQLHDRASKRAEFLGIHSMSVTISHSKGHALAFVVGNMA